jgi:hypothetical protein
MSSTSAGIRPSSSRDRVKLVSTGVDSVSVGGPSTASVPTGAATALSPGSSKENEVLATISPVASDDCERDAFWTSAIGLACDPSVLVKPPTELLASATRLSGDAPVKLGSACGWGGIAIARAAGTAAVGEESVPPEGVATEDASAAGGDATGVSVTGAEPPGGSATGAVMTGAVITGAVVTGGSATGADTTGGVTDSGGVEEVGGATLSSCIATAGAGPETNGGALSSCVIIARETW